MIQVGDEVIIDDGMECDAERYVVIAVNRNEDNELFAALLSRKNFICFWAIDCLKQTGRHFDELDVIFKKLEEE